MQKETLTSLKKVAYVLGKTLGLLGLIFVFYSLSKEYTLSSFVDKIFFILPILIPLVLINILSMLLGIYAWHMMLIHYAKKHFSYLVSYYYFTKTEIAKYLPGNVFHFLGRQAIASKIGIKQVEMVKVSALLTFLLLVATTLSSTFFAIFAKGIADYLLLLLLLATVFTLFTVFFTYKSFPLIKKTKINILLALSVALQGIMLGIIMMHQSENFDTELFFLYVSIYIISWLIGFVTPGASGGLGVREGAFIAIVAFLHMDITSEIVIFSVLLVRLINIFVDSMLFISTFLLESKINKLHNI